MTDNLFVDTNIIIEILLQRSKYDACGDILMSYSHQYLSPSSVHIIFYYAESLKLDLANVERFLRDFRISKFNQQDYDLALELYRQKDMEDALQVACCLHNNISDFVTLDKDLAKKYGELLHIIIP